MATFTNISKSSTTSVTVDKTDPIIDTVAYLDIGDGYNLLIGGVYKLIIQPLSSGTSWQNVSKS